MSLIVQPAPRMTNEPRPNSAHRDTNSGVGGDANAVDQRHGCKSRNVPMGLSRRARRAYGWSDLGRYEMLCIDGSEGCGCFLLLVDCVDNFTSSTLDDNGNTDFCGIEEILIFGFGDDSLEIALLLLYSSSPDDCEYNLLAVNKVVWFLLFP